MTSRVFDRHLNLILILVSLTFVLSARANAVERLVVDRVENFKAKKVYRKLDDLTSSNSYEGLYFKVVMGKSDEAVSFKASDEIQLKAATTYYHLTKARNYFINEIQSDFVRQLPQIVVRLDIVNKFNELGHFSHDNMEPEFNNAVSIPSGDGYASRGIHGWEKEIWFRPPKRVHVSEFQGEGIDQQGLILRNSLKSFRAQTHMVTLNKFLARSILDQDVIIQGGSPFETLMRTAGTSVMLEFIYYGTDFAADFFSRDWYYLDSALVPEIIYHEYTHVALSDHLAISHSTPVNEGLADYFAGKIAKSDELATKIDDYNLFSGKKVRKKDLYFSQFERNEFANSDFVFGLLYQSEKILDENVAPSFIYQMRNKLSSDSKIRDGLLDAFVKTCRDVCDNPFLKNLELYKLFQKKGF